MIDQIHQRSVELQERIACSTTEETPRFNSNIPPTPPTMSQVKEEGAFYDPQNTTEAYLQTTRLIDDEDYDPEKESSDEEVIFQRAIIRSSDTVKTDLIDTKDEPESPQPNKEIFDMSPLLETPVSPHPSLASPTPSLSHSPQYLPSPLMKKHGKLNVI